MAKSVQKTGTKALTVSTQTLDVIDLTNYSGVSATLKCLASASGTLFLEWCNFNSTVDGDWKAVPTAQYPNASVALVASQSVTVNASLLSVGFIRVRVTLGAGAGNYDYYALGKEM